MAGFGLATALAGVGAVGLGGRVDVAPADAALSVVAETVRRLPTRRAPEPPAELGRFQLTFYWLATERRAHRPGGEEVTLMSQTCAPIAHVSPTFARNLRLEGSGILRDGRIVGVATRCECGAPCYRTAPRGHRFGTGAAQRPLAPFRSVAVDSSVVPMGTKLYVPALDGMTMPGSAPWGGFVHDGCVVADDRGGNIRGKQLDLFTVRRQHYKALSRRINARKVTVHDGSTQCAGSPSTRVVAARRGGV